MRGSRKPRRPRKPVGNEELKRLLEFQILLQSITNRRILYIMSTLSDLTAAIDTLTTKVEEDDQVISSIATYVDGIKQQLVDIKAQLDEALANQNQAAIDEANTKLTVLIEKIDGQQIAEKAIANTPAEESEA